jgi:hypothetical protein
MKTGSNLNLGNQQRQHGDALLENELGQKMPVLTLKMENIFLGSESTQLNKSFYMHT